MSQPMRNVGARVTVSTPAYNGWVEITAVHPEADEFSDQLHYSVETYGGAQRFKVEERDITGPLTKAERRARGLPEKPTKEEKEHLR